MLNSRMTGSGSYVNLLKLDWENSWNHINLILAVFSRLKPIWSGVRSPAQLLSSTELTWQGKADRPCWCELRLACFGWSFSPPPLSSQAALQPQLNLAHGGVDENLFKIHKFWFWRNIWQYFCTTWNLKWKVCLYVLRNFCVNQLSWMTRKLRTI